MPDAFHLAFAQRGVLEVVLLSGAAGVLGTWIVMRGLAFYAHAVGTAAFPGLVIADGLAFSPQVGAFAAAMLFAFGIERLARRPRAGYDSLTALVLAAALAAGVVLASNVFHSSGTVDTLLFGSLLVIGRDDLLLAAAVSTIALLATMFLGPRWLAVGFDPGAARSMGLRSAGSDAALVVLVAATVVASLAALGALLATALLVVPAATVRLWTSHRLRWQAGAVVLVIVEGIAGLWLAVRTNTPPGATIAVCAGVVFATTAILRRLRPVIRRPATAAIAVAIVVGGAFAGCGGTRAADGGRPVVVATTTQLGDIVRNVGGDAVAVHQLLAPNSDPHDYEPRPDDVTATARAAVAFTSGLGLDGWMSKVIAEAGGSPAVVDLGAAAPVRRPGDPHWWHDPRNAVAAVNAVRDALSAADPAAAATFAANAAAYRARLAALDRSIAACMAAIPPAERRLVSDHDAFGYFAARYGIDVVGAVIPSSTTRAQPAAGDLAALIDLIDRQHVRAIFPETSLNPKLAEQIASETGARTDLSLYGDALGPAGSAGATYLGMEAANADALARGFSGGTRRCAA
jgi:zinc/manganese transport system substrate-binding protein